MREPHTGRLVFRAYCDKHSQLQRDKAARGLTAPPKPVTYAPPPPPPPPLHLPEPSRPLLTMGLELERWRRLRGDFERLRVRTRTYASALFSWFFFRLTDVPPE